MTKPVKLDRTGRVYVRTVVALGFGVVVHSLYRLHLEPVGYPWFLLAGLTLLSGSFTIKIPSLPARLSVSETFVFAAVLLYGTAAATMIAVLDTLVISLWSRRKSLRYVFFNATAPALSLWLASTCFFWLAGRPPLSIEKTPILDLVLPLVALASLYFICNSGFVAFAVAAEKRLPIYRTWRDNFSWLSINYFGGASMAALLVPYAGSVDSSVINVIGIIVPLFLVSYLTIKTAMARVEDAQSHLEQMNAVYLSTIEALAIAIDAKDQVTHGHIRRVQFFAVNLARALGITDQGHLRAMEAAALLHDVGKLAVPEYILNKPGTLTPAEFEKIKLHTIVGAEILASVKFPYPVAPIVRHHHESWDGNGYPSGLKGTDIPLGARILAVVDCFDALTSDRPYRPRLPDEQALHVLVERRGSMYDPVVVDTFLELYRKTAQSATRGSALPTGGRDWPAGGQPRPDIAERVPQLDRIAASTEETLALYQMTAALVGRVAVDEIVQAAFRCFSRALPPSVWTWYLYDSASNDLVAAHATGRQAELVKDLRIALSQRITGWTAANRQTSLNSDPVLDLGEIARCTSPRLRSALACPLIHGEHLVGVLTLYAPGENAFSEDHRRITEALATQVAPALARAANSVETRSGSSGVSVRSSGVAVDEASTAPGPMGGALAQFTPPFSVVVLAPRAAAAPDSSSQDHWHDTLTAVLRATYELLESTGGVLSREGDELILVLPQTSAIAAGRLLARFRASVDSISAGASSQTRLSDVLLAGLATAPEDGRSLDLVVRAARLRTVSLFATRRVGPSSDQSTIH